MVLATRSRGDLAANAACVREIQIHFSPLFDTELHVDCCTHPHAHMPRLPRRDRIGRADILSAAPTAESGAEPTALTPHDRQSLGGR